jgi:hypothetical protein
MAIPDLTMEVSVTVDPAEAKAWAVAPVARIAGLSWLQITDLVAVESMERMVELTLENSMAHQRCQLTVLQVLYFEYWKRGGT